MSSIQESLILSHLRTLKMPAIRAEYAAVARRAQKDGWSYEAYLQELLDVEMRSREEHMACKRLKEARFPEIKTLEQIDWDVMAGVSRQKVAQLASGEFIDKAEDVIIGGPIGTGQDSPGDCPRGAGSQAPHEGRFPEGRRGGPHAAGGA